MAEAGPTPASHELAHYIGPLRRHRVFIALCLVLGLALGVLGSIAVGPSYTSTVRVLVLADITDQGNANSATSRTTGAVNMDTEAQVIKSEPVAKLAQAELKTTLSATKLISRLTVTVPANTTVLAATYKADSPAAAQAGATAFATAYLANRTSVAQDAVKAQIASVDKQVSDLETSLRKLTVAVNKANPGPAKNYAIKQESRLQAQINSLNPQINRLTTAVVNPGRVISPANSGAKQILNQEIILLSGALLGLLLGLLGALVRERTGRVVRSPADLDDLGVRTLSWEGDAKDGDRPRRISGRRRGRSIQHQAAAVISAALKSGGVVYVATVTGSPSAPRIAGQLSRDLRRFGGTATVLPVEQATGGQLAPDQPDSPLLSTRAGAEAAVGWPLDMAEPQNGRARLNATSLRDLADSARVRADYVLIDGNDAARDSEAYLAASSADASLLVIRPGLTRRRDLRLVVEEIRLTSSHLIGAVFVTKKQTAIADGPTEPALTSRSESGSTRGGGPRSNVTAGERVLESPPVGRE